MQVLAHLKDALFNLASYKMRSVLAMIGILVGTASVVAMVMTAQLATEQALARFKPLGTNLMSAAFYLNKANSNDSEKLTVEDVIGIVDLDKEILQVAAYTKLSRSAYFSDIKIKGNILGVEASLKNILSLRIADGRFLSDLDEHSRFIVIGDDIKKQLNEAGLSNIIGEQIRLGREYYTVIGLLEKKSGHNFFFQDVNRVILMPLSTSLSVDRRAEINNMVMNLVEGANFKQLETLLRAYFKQFSIDMNVYVQSAEEVVQQMKSQSKIFTILLGLIGSISLFVGGIGVMNIMLVSVTERRQEIGIRKAIGARLNDIYGLFLFESMIISLLGGVIGVVLGLIITYFICQYASWPFHLNLTPAITGFLVSVSIGIFFGFYPAYKAAHLAPIEALRN